METKPQASPIAIKHSQGDEWWEPWGFIPLHHVQPRGEGRVPFQSRVLWRCCLSALQHCLCSCHSMKMARYRKLFGMRINRIWLQAKMFSAEMAKTSPASETAQGCWSIHYTTRPSSMLQVLIEKAEEPLGYRQWSFVHAGGVRLDWHLQRREDDALGRSCNSVVLFWITVSNTEIAPRSLAVCEGCTVLSSVQAQNEITFSEESFSCF